MTEKKHGATSIETGSKPLYRAQRELEEELAERDAEIRRLSRIVSELEFQVEHRDAVIGDLTERVGDLREQVAARDV